MGLKKPIFLIASHTTVLNHCFIYTKYPSHRFSRKERNPHSPEVLVISLIGQVPKIKDTQDVDS